MLVYWRNGASYPTRPYCKVYEGLAWPSKVIYPRHACDHTRPVRDIIRDQPLAPLRNLLVGNASCSSAHFWHLALPAPTKKLTREHFSRGQARSCSLGKLPSACKANLKPASAMNARRARVFRVETWWVRRQQEQEVREQRTLAAVAPPQYLRSWGCYLARQKNYSPSGDLYVAPAPPPSAVGGSR